MNTIIGKELASALPQCVNQQCSFTYINRIKPTVTDIDLSYGRIAEGIEKMKNNKACGPDNVSSRLIKSAGDAIIPSLYSVYKISASSNIVPSTWKFAWSVCFI